MVRVNKSITINSDKYKIWKFLSDLSLGLRFNRFHKEINFNKSFSIHSDQEIIIKHNFGFGVVDMNLRVISTYAKTFPDVRLHIADTGTCKLRITDNRTSISNTSQYITKTNIL